MLLRKWRVRTRRRSARFTTRPTSIFPRPSSLPAIPNMPASPFPRMLLSTSTPLSSALLPPKLLWRWSRYVFNSCLDSSLGTVRPGSVPCERRGLGLSLPVAAQIAASTFDDPFSYLIFYSLRTPWSSSLMSVPTRDRSPRLLRIYTTLMLNTLTPLSALMVRRRLSSVFLLIRRLLRLPPTLVLSKCFHISSWTRWSLISLWIAFCFSFFCVFFIAWSQQSISWG